MFFILLFLFSTPIKEVKQREICGPDKNQTEGNTIYDLRESWYLFEGTSEPLPSFLKNLSVSSLQDLKWG